MVAGLVSPEFFLSHWLADGHLLVCPGVVFPLYAYVWCPFMNPNFFFLFFLTFIF